jgi:glycosyltransferase involved in cell wall biosynthesis
VRAALVVQRYGNDVLGGAESLARHVAELLNPHLELTVLTTCALDYLTWADHYLPGEDEVNGVRVLRFPVPRPRDVRDFELATGRAYQDPSDIELGRAWMEAQGPNAPALLKHLREQGSTYDAVAFITYLYATTADGLPLVAERSLLCPTMHDEPPLKLALFDGLFSQARLCLFSTPEERELARSRFGVPDEQARVVGAGIDEPLGSDSERFTRESGIKRRYALYVGRLDPSKGVPDLIDFHSRYRARQPDGLDLVLIGGGDLMLPASDGFHALGYVTEQQKHDAIEGAAVVVCPSPYESLSFAQLEAWSHGRPTLANAVSPVLEGQSKRAGGGLWYANVDEYGVMLDLLARAEPLAAAIGAQGRRYVREAYSWDHLRNEWLSAIDAVARTVNLAS